MINYKRMKTKMSTMMRMRMNMRTNSSRMVMKRTPHLPTIIAPASVNVQTANG